MFPKEDGIGGYSKSLVLTGRCSIMRDIQEVRKMAARHAILIALLVTALSSCGHAMKEINEKEHSIRGDVFTEIREDRIRPEGFADLRIKVSVKTHDVGYYLEPESSLHGKPGYPYLINIDGQAAIWKIDGEEESTPVYDKDGKRMPEGGKGRRYDLDKKVRLSAGSHHVFLGLPEEEYYTETNLKLKSGESYTLEYKPVYDAYGHRRPAKFTYGIKKLEVYLNGTLIQ
jgi:hypothetical protein